MTKLNTERPRLLVVTDIPFWRLQRGSAKRILSMLDFLSESVALTICFVGEQTIREWIEAERALPYPIVGPGQPGKVATSVVNRLRSILPRPIQPVSSPGNTATLHDFQCSAISDFVERSLEEVRPDAVMLQYVTMAGLCEPIKRKRPNTQVIVDTHDVMHIRQEALARHQLKNWLDINLEDESRALSGADVVLAIQEQDAERFKEMLDPDTRVVVCKHAARPHSNKRDPAEPTPTVGYLASGGRANQIGLSWFLENCWPQIVTAMDRNLRLVIAGEMQLPTSNSCPSSTENGVIQCLGRVDRLEDFYGQVDVAINPAQIESGLKIKSLEALAFGLPLVTTSAGIAGLESAQGRCAEIANRPDEFADRVCSLLNDNHRRELMREQARNLITREFSPDQVYRELLDVVTQARNRQ